MRVALLGASGMVGFSLVEELTGRGHLVTGICRNPSRLDPRANLTLVASDASRADALAPALAGHDAIVIAVRFLAFDTAGMMAGIRRSGIKRVIMAGNSGSLFVAPDMQLLDTASMSAFFKPEALDAREAFKILRRADDLLWTYASPAGLLTPAKRTGEFRYGNDELLRDRYGESRISSQDLAIAIVDELETPQYIRKRFTVAY